MLKKKLTALVVAASMTAALTISASAAVTDTAEGDFPGLILIDFTQDDFMGGIDEAAGAWWQNTFGTDPFEPTSNGDSTATFGFVGENSKYRFASKDGGIYGALAIRVKADSVVPGDQVFLRIGSGDKAVEDKEGQYEPTFAEIVGIDGEVLGDITTEWQTFVIDVDASGYAIDGSDVVTFHVDVRTAANITFDYIAVGQLDEVAGLIAEDEDEPEEETADDDAAEEAAPAETAETAESSDDAASAESAETAETTETAASAGDTSAATSSDSKGNADTGIAGVAAVAGIGLLSAGAVVFSRKRK